MSFDLIESLIISILSKKCKLAHWIQDGCRKKILPGYHYISKCRSRRDTHYVKVWSKSLEPFFFNLKKTKIGPFLGPHTQNNQKFWKKSKPGDRSHRIQHYLKFWIRLYNFWVHQGPKTSDWPREVPKIQNGGKKLFWVGVVYSNQILKNELHRFIIKVTRFQKLLIGPHNQKWRPK